MTQAEEELEKSVALIESAAERATRGFRSMRPAVSSIRQRAPHVCERLLPSLAALRQAIDELIESAKGEPKA
jgi:hypothetical protein